MTRNLRVYVKGPISKLLPDFEGKVGFNTCPKGQERRSLMRGTKRVLLFALIALLFAVSVTAQNEHMLPLEKNIKSGLTVIRYDNIAYRINSRTSLNLTFERIDERYVGLSARPIAGSPVQPYYEFSIQWSGFSANLLDFSAPGGTYTLDTETGYAEK